MRGWPELSLIMKGETRHGESVMRKSWYSVLVLFLLSSVLVGCSSSPAPTAAAAALLPQPSTTPSATAQTDTIASGPIVVEEQVDLAAQRDGIVAEISVEAGATVKKGQLLARLDDRQLTADRDAAAAKVRSTDADLKNWEAGANVARVERERAEELWKANIIAKEQVEKATYQSEATDYEVERQREDLHYEQETLRSLDLELEKTRITAPFDGVVARRYVRVGQEVAKHDRLFWVSALGPLRVKFSLPESYMGRVQRGTQLIATTAEAVNQTHQATVVLVSPVVDPSSDTIDVTAEVQGPIAGLRPGMVVNLRMRNPQ
jgi:membrane fusion protein, multidrug efflux system